MKLLKTFFLLVLLVVLSLQSLCFVPIDNDGNWKLSLNGKWRFVFNEEKRGFESKDYNDSGWADIDVPSNWELKGFEEPKYAKPRPGTGLYRRKFMVDKDWKSRKIFIRFEGVAFGFEFWVNGKRVGEFNSSFNRSEFDITEYIKTGEENVIAVCVDRRRKGWDFDSHDSWGLSGIFRDVVVFSVPRLHIKDYRLKTDLKSDLSCAEVNAEILLSKSIPCAISKSALTAFLYDPDNKLVSEKKINLSDKNPVSDLISLNFTVDKPVLWSAEHPLLYTFEMNLINGIGSEHLISKKIGVRQIDIKGDVLRVNFRPVKLRGVNHHDIHFEVGRALEKVHYLQDIELMKRANINAVRTSHYPPSPEFIDLCDRLGLYVICEVPFGKGEKHLHEDSYLEILFERAYSTVMRDINNPSVIIWAVGNENPVLENVIKTVKYVRELDKTRPVLLPGAGEGGGTWDVYLPEEADIIAPHYPYAYPVKGRGRWNLYQAATTDRIDKPVLCTEFNHSLGNAFEGLRQRWEVIEKHDRLAGGCIWHFQDQGIKRKLKRGVRVLKNDIERLDADDFDEPVISPDLWVGNDTVIDSCGASGSDGIVYADRFAQVDYWITRKVYSPVYIPVDRINIESGSKQVRIPVHNRYDFTDLGKIKGRWKLVCEGDVVEKGDIILSMPPRKKGFFEVKPTFKNIGEDRLCWLFFEFTDFNNRRIYEHTIKLFKDNPFCRFVKKLQRFSGPVLKTLEREDIIFTENKFIKFFFDTRTGRIYLIAEESEKILLEGIYIDIGRKPELAELKRMSPVALEINNRRFLTDCDIEDFEICVNSDELLEIDFCSKYELEHKELEDAHFVLDCVLRVFSNGYVELKGDLSANNIDINLLEAGLAFQTCGDMDRLCWLGDGPYESYPGQSDASEFGVWSIKPLPLEDPRSRYYPGNRENVYLAAVCNQQNNGAGFIFDNGIICLENHKNSMYISSLLRSAGKGNKTGGMKTLYPVKAEEIEKVKFDFYFKALNEKNCTSLFNTLLLNDREDKNGL